MKSTDVLKYLEGSCSDEEKREMAEWLEVSPENEREFNEIRFIFEATKIYGPELRQRAAATGRRPEPDGLPGRVPGTALRKHPWRSGVHWIMRAAAVIALVLGAVYATYVFTCDRLSGQMLALEIPAGERIELTLPDSSHVWLNSGARLEYPTVFGRHRREVRLCGEAMFEVRHDADHPFVVRTFASDVEVLGTRFNVEADAGERLFSTTLFEGRLRLTDPTTHEHIILNPNDEARLCGGRLLVASAADADAACWTEGLISIAGLSFGELMRKFEMAYDVRIEIRRATMPSIGFKSGKIRISDGVDHALQVLQHNSDFRFEHDVENNTVTIY